MVVSIPKCHVSCVTCDVMMMMIMMVVVMMMGIHLMDFKAFTTLHFRKELTSSKLKCPTNARCTSGQCQTCVQKLLLQEKKQMMILHSLIMSHGSFEAIPSLYFCVQNDGWKNCRKCFLFPFSSCLPLSFVELYSFDEVLHRCWKSNLQPIKSGSCPRLLMNVNHSQTRF